MTPLAFWEFKARCAELDLQIVRARMKVDALMATRNGILEAFCRAHGFDAARPLVLEDTTCAVTQETV